MKGINSAAGLLSSLHDVYSQLHCYRDSGAVLIPVAPHRPHTLKFRTTFIRGELFKFEFLEPVPHIDYNPKFDYTAVISSRDKNILIYIGEGMESRVEYLTSIDGAIGRITATSSGAAQTISKLLMPNEVRGFSVSGLLDAKVSRTFEQEGVTMTEVEGRGPFNQEYVLCIRQADGSLIYRKRRQDESGEWTIETRRPLSFNIGDTHIDSNFDTNELVQYGVEAIRSWDKWAFADPDQGST